MSAQPPKGCSFLLNAVGTEEIFTPSAFTDDQRMFAKTAEDFMEKEIFPDVDRLEAQEDGLMLAKLKKAGEVGLLMIDVPESYGGLDLDKTTSMLCAEKLATYGGFSVSHSAHSGIGSLPLLYFGNDEQKQRYAPKLATGELIAAYALTEPGSGSDALGALTTAELVEEDGEQFYKLNGTKMWITNAGFADLFTVFAKVDGKAFTAFLVDATMAGVSTGAEEHKMGIKGSSTRMVILDDVLVPVANVLGQIGRGHKIAFNILNVGRFKLGVSVLGSAKRCLEISIKYALERKQFNQPIAQFGAIQQKIALMVARTYALEAMCYRVAGYMDHAIDSLDSGAESYPQQVMAAIEEFAIEDSIMKVYGSETLDFVADEGVQIHGGYGYSKEYEIERSYRDSRINRIFEGTNEINRMLIPGMILKRTMKGELQLFELIEKIEATLGADKETAPPHDPEGIAQELFLTEKAKQLTLYVANQAIQKHMGDLKDQQEILIAMADMFSHCYALDSVNSRISQSQRARGATQVELAIAQHFTANTYNDVVDIAYRTLPMIVGGDKLGRRFANAEQFVHRPTANVLAAQRTIATYALEHPRWSLR